MTETKKETKKETKAVDSMAQAHEKEQAAVKAQNESMTEYEKVKSKEYFKFKGNPTTYVKLKDGKYLDLRDSCVYTGKNPTQIVEVLS